MATTNLYQDIILERAHRPRHFGEQADAASAVARNHPCGDHLTIYTATNEAGILTVTFTGIGCVIATASADLMADVISGQTPKAARTTAAAVITWLTGVGNVPDERLQIFAGVKTRISRQGCVLTSWRALCNALPTVPQSLLARPVTKTNVYAALKTVLDPELLVNIVDLGLVYDVKIDAKKNVTITMTFTTPSCPAANEIINTVRLVVGKLTGVSTTSITITFTPPWTRERIHPDVRFALGV